MKLLVAPTDILKLWISPSTVLQSINSKISGWCTFITAMLAPSLFPPCVTRVETDESSLRAAIGPHAFPWVVLILAPFGLNLDKANPVPPPNFCTIAASWAVFMMCSILSSRGKTKHADKVPAGVPAFIRVGELAKNSRLASAS